MTPVIDSRCLRKVSSPHAWPPILCLLYITSCPNKSFTVDHIRISTSRSDNGCNHAQFIVVETFRFVYWGWSLSLGRIGFAKSKVLQKSKKSW